MKIRVRQSKDFYAGLMFLFFGVLFLLVARHYPMGTAKQMGPGYFPALLGGFLALIGAAISVGGLRSGGEMIKSWPLRPLLLVSGAVLAFAVLVRPLGLVLAVLILVVTSSLSGSEFRFREVIGLCIVLSALAVIVFVYGFRLPWTVWP